VHRAVEAYVARIDAARLDGAQLLGIGAEVFVDAHLSARQREMLIARAAASNRPGYPHEHAVCRGNEAARCPYCLKGPGPGLAADGGRWFDDAAFTWRNRHARPIAPVPPEEWRFVSPELVERTIRGRVLRLCMSCAAGAALREQETPPTQPHGRRRGPTGESRRSTRQLALNLDALA
jgi:hypothetical protein